MTDRTFFKTTITVHVLSEGAPLEWDDLGDVAYAISEGDCVGVTGDSEMEILTFDQAKEFCDNCGSEIEFFGDLTVTTGIDMPFGKNIKLEN